MYTIQLLDTDRNTVASTEEETLKAAKSAALYYIKADPEYLSMPEVFKSEVLDASGDVVADYFRERMPSG